MPKVAVHEALVLLGIVYLLCQAVAALFGITLTPDALLLDLAVHGALAALLLAICRQRALLVLLLALAIGALHFGMAAKIAVFGGPLTPDDLAAAPALFLILPPWQRLALALLLLAATLAFVANLSFRRPPARWAAALTVALALPFVLAPRPLVAWLDTTFGHVDWNQRWNYESRGPLRYLLHETARHLAHRAPPPHRGAVLEAAEGLIARWQPAAFAAEAPPPPRRRNVHLILLESFWDPTRLKGAGLSRDPWVREFRALWEAGGRSQLLSPVFGGYTANAEFEILCGLPVNEDKVMFEAAVRRDVPCLPRHLADLGYEAVASHPNIAAFWNRVNAYRRLGFTAYWSIADFVADDMNGDFLSDASLFRQVLQKIEPLFASETPVFNYVLTLSGHLYYPLNAARPPVVEVASGHELLTRYANTVHYTSREVMAMLAELRARDGDGLIIIASDHLPFLGEQFDAYAASGLLASRFEEFTDEMWLTYVATPLIVIDGRRGPVRVGTLPMYHLPRLILDLLGDRRPALPRLAADASGELGLVRPLPGLALSLAADGRLTLCRRGGNGGEAPACAGIWDWQRRLQTLASDVLAGRQHLLHEVLVAPSPTPRPRPTLPAEAGGGRQT